MTARTKIEVALDGGRPGDIIKVEGSGIATWPNLLLRTISIGSIELFYELDAEGREGRLLDRIYRFDEREWGFVELGYGVNGTVAEVRIVKRVDNAPPLSLEELSVEEFFIRYGMEIFHKQGQGVSNGYLITPEGVKRDGQSSWVALYTHVDPAQVLVYAWWEGGSGVYWGYVIPHDSVSIYMKVSEAVEVTPES